MEGFGNFPIRKLAYVFHEQVRFGNQLHIRIFNTVMHHFHIVPGTVFSNVGTAGRTILRTRCDSLQNLSDFLIGRFVSTGHNARSKTRTILTTGDSHTEIMQSLFFQICLSADGILEEGIPAIQNHIPLLQQWNQLFYDGIHCFSRLYHQHDLTRLFQ